MILTSTEDVLRTRVVSTQKLLEKWHDAISTELRQLFDEKQALVRISQEEFEAMKQKYGAKLTVVPMKAVLTKKPGPKRRFQMVACGKFAEKDPEQEVYAAGADDG